MRESEPTRETSMLGGNASKVVGIYQLLLRQFLDHFFPEGAFEPDSDRSSIELLKSLGRSNFRINEDPDGLGVLIDWFRSKYSFRPTSPSPFSASERRLIQVIAHVLDARFRAMFDLAGGNRPELFHYAVEDFIIGEFLSPPNLIRVPAAIETLRVAALSTYEGRRVSTGVVLVGTPDDPVVAGAVHQDAPRFDIRLSSLKTFHRICDGLKTLFLVTRDGVLSRVIDIETWAAKAEEEKIDIAVCPKPYESHARATLSGQHISLVLTPWQEIKVFAGGNMAFAFSDARWRLLDIPAKAAAWRQAVGAAEPPDLADRIFQAALNLGEAHSGALIVILRDPHASFPRLVAPGDRINDVDDPKDEPVDPDHEIEFEGVSHQHMASKHALHHLVRDRSIRELDPAVLEALAGVDGAVVFDRTGRLLTFGAILRIPPETFLPARAIEGARTTAALVASFHGPALKVSEDGYITMFLGGRRIWEI